MGEVWSVRNERTNRDFAIKFLLPELAREPEALRRFVREAKATGSLRHPNVVAAMDAGMHEGQPYLVMELLSGESLEARLQRDEKLSPLEACILLAQVARALSHAHLAGLAHRDLSSANVFLCDNTDDGPPIAKVLDFGVSKVLGDAPTGKVRTEGGKILGSPSYMSPEQARGDESVDARTDLWSLGVVAYQCLSGQLPFTGPNYNALLFAILQGPHEPLQTRCPRLPSELCDLVESCLVKDSELRAASAKTMAELFEQVALRLATEQGKSRYLPLRRQADRVRMSEPGMSAQWVSRRALPGRALPVLTRLAQNLQAIPRSTMLSLGIILGVGAGILGAKAVMPSTPSGISATPLPKSVCEGPSDPLSEPLPLSDAAPGTAAAKAASNETDLVRALARGLDVPRGGGKLPLDSSRSRKP